MPLQMRNFSEIERLVIKVGTNVLAPGGIPNYQRMDAIAADTAEIQKRELSPIIVSSGAIGFGARALALDSRPRKVEVRQACAAVGQPILMRHWQQALSDKGSMAAQILLSREIFDERKSYLNLRTAVENLLSMNVVPIMNENDSVSTAEIGDVFGDNDSLSAHIASKLNADLLVLLTDIDALYERNPKTYPEAKRINLVKEITPQIRAAAGRAGSEHATGGMITKLNAVEIASRAGCRTVLADGRVPGNLVRIINGDEIGTLFMAGARAAARTRWILGARAKGRIHIDDGAMEAIRKKKSLLPSGVTDVDGVFNAGDVVLINSRCKAVSSMSSEEIRSLSGSHSSQVKKQLGQDRREEVALVEDIALLE